MKCVLLVSLLALLSGCAVISESAGGNAALHPLGGGQPDFVRARDLFQAGAAKGDATSEAKYAAMCIAGLGGPVDIRAAFDNLQAADRQDSEFAEVLLADLYAHGDTTLALAPDFDRALAFAHRAEGKHKKPVQDLIAYIQRMQHGGPAELVKRLSPPRPPGTDGPPQLIEEVLPNYPIPLQILDLRAVVLVDFRVRLDGTTSDVRVVTPTLPQFDAAAIAAIARFKFLPGIKAGKPAVVHMRIPITFTTSWF
ncbi:MAG TPA: TonB family protein [Opitutaceae bacterium]|nr:TonB family protein [Opitutaceae bacterium]